MSKDDLGNRMNSYSGFKLLCRQWSWNNDKPTFIMCSIIGSLMALSALLNVNSEHTIPYELVLMTFAGAIAYILVLANTLKLVVFAPVCLFIAWMANKQEERAIRFYEEMSDWRKK